MNRLSAPSLANSLTLKLTAFAILFFASTAILNVASANAADGTIIATKGADRSASSADYRCDDLRRTRSRRHIRVHLRRPDPAGGFLDGFPRA